MVRFTNYKHLSMTTFDVTIDHANKRIDACIADSMPDMTRGQIVKAIKSGDILCNDKQVKPSYKLKIDDVLTVPKIEVPSDTLTPNAEIPLTIIDENDQFIIIDKPRGLQVHPSHTEKTNTLVNALFDHFPDIIDVGDEPGEYNQRPGIMSRLDKYTSGLMVVAKDQDTFLALKKQFSDRKVHKTYEALVWGEPKEPEGTIDAPIARAVGYTRQKVAFGKFTGDAKEAITEYKTLATYDVTEILGLENTKQRTKAGMSENKRQNLAHLEIHPLTGRMHQIRVHLAHIGRSIVGDIKYERKNEKLLNKKLFALVQQWTPEDYQTFYLHAAKLEFELDGKKHSYTSPLPRHFGVILENL